MPRPVVDGLARLLIFADATVHYPFSLLKRGRGNGVNTLSLGSQWDANTNLRVFDYNHMLLPNAYIAQLEEGVRDVHTAYARTGDTIGYPAWNLLYYVILCSLPRNTRDLVVVETGTNKGLSTIILAQALKDLGATGPVRTVDIDANKVELAKHNVAEAGLSGHVEFHVADSLAYLLELVRTVPAIHFAFLDGDHEYLHVREEFDIIYQRILAGGGTVYFDNTTLGGVRWALQYIRHAYPGHLVEFPFCSSCPPGNAVWRPE